MPVELHTSETTFAETIRRQRMIRPPYLDKPVSRSLVSELVSASQKAPSAGFTQGASFLALDGPHAARFFEITMPDYVDRLLPCPTVLLPLEDKNAYLARYSEPDKAAFGMGTEDGWAVPYWTVDAAFAAMVVLMAATAHGLGAWFFAIYSHTRELLDEYGVPEHLRPIGAMTVGYPTDHREAPPTSRRPRRPLDEVLRWNRW